MKESINNWELLTQKDFPKLKEASVQLHQAAQFIAIIGKYLVPREPDDGHTAMEWLNYKKVLAGNWVDNQFRVGLKPESFALIAYDLSMDMHDWFLLNGKTKDEAFDWLRQVVQDFGGDSSKLSMKMHYEISRHETDKGARFKMDHPEYFIEIDKYRANSDAILKAIASQFTGATPVRTWPHHYDTGSYLTVGKDSNGETTKSCGFGWSIADSYSKEPYFYVNTWSKEEMDLSRLPELEEGEWYRGEWTGAVLRSGHILQYAKKEDQAQVVIRFLTAGIEASLQLLGNSSSALKK